MMDFEIHFVKNLPESQGKVKLPFILLLDGHASRWNAESLLYFMSNVVYPFILVLHTSILSQPKNNGPNLKIHKCVEGIVTEFGFEIRR